MRNGIVFRVIGVNICVADMNRDVIARRGQPFSYVVSPVEVISMGAFSGVLDRSWIKLALAKRVAINKTSVRMAHAERTAQGLPAKLKALQRNKGHIMA